MPVPGRGRDVVRPFLAATVVCLSCGPAVRIAAEDKAAAPLSGQSGDASPSSNGYVINGRCYEQDFRKPIPHVQLRLYFWVQPDVPRFIAETASDADGKFTFKGLEPPRRESEFHSRLYAVAAAAEGRPPVLGEDWSGLNRDVLNLFLDRQAGIAAGRVVDARGKPVAGAVVARGMTGHAWPLAEIPTAITDEAGEFVLPNVPINIPVADRPSTLQLLVQHPDHPPTRFTQSPIPAAWSLTLPDGCTVTGSVVDDATGQAAAGVRVVAENFDTGQEQAAFTDEDGRFRMVLLETNYQLRANTADRISIAVVNLECPGGQSIELPPFRLQQGGWIAGRVFHKPTDQPAVLSHRGERIVVGLLGPAFPASNIMKSRWLAEVDDEGRFLLQAAPGENFPYLVNAQGGDRNLWDRPMKPAVVVRAGETANCDIAISPRLTAAEKMQAAQRVLDAFPQARDARAAAVLEEFRKLNHTVDETETWCLLMRDLVQIGPPAVPQLCAELDRTQEQRLVRRLAFALRAIGDPRAVPALIRAIPKSLLGSGDYGLIVDDPDLTVFMQTHDNDGKIPPEGGTGLHFSFGSPFHEIFPALRKLTGRNFNETPLNWISLSKDARQAALQRRLFHEQAELWQAWWEAHWQEFTQDVNYAKVNLPAVEEVPPRQPRALGPGSIVTSRSSGSSLSPYGEPGKFAFQFLDLDTGLSMKWPDGIPYEEGIRGEAITAWITQHGFDLMCDVHRSSGGFETSALRPLNMRVWEITPNDARNLEKRVQAGKLPAGPPVTEFLFHVDPDTGDAIPEKNASFLYETSEGSLGLISVTDRVTRRVDLTGSPFGPGKGEGFHLGVRFDHATILP